MTDASWGAITLLEVFLLLIGIAMRVGFDMPWGVAMFPFYIPPVTILLLHVGWQIAQQIHLYP